ncbi:MAG TPA: hypothetical protein VGR68_02595 [Actinomycetota bacterium]|nr:hypothetical protein [Actinomycetota bacterium]
MSTILVGTDDGLHTVGDGAAVAFSGHAVGALAGGDGSVWAVVDGREVRGGQGAFPERPAVPAPGLRLNCLAVAGGTVVAGTAEAHLLRLEGRELRRVEPFDQTEGRDGWYTPWGGPPDVRSIAVGSDGALWVNVHVGGIPTSADGGLTWRPTIEVDADVHQVLVHPGDPARVLAATARGLADSSDGGRSWRFLTEGLHAVYCRAVALAGDTVAVSCSTGPRGGHAALYRRPLDAEPGTPFERCQDGLPEWFQGNLDTACVAAAASTVAFGTADGEVFASEDAGVSWARVADGLPPVRCLLV